MDKACKPINVSYVLYETNRESIIKSYSRLKRHQNQSSQAMHKPKDLFSIKNN